MSANAKRITPSSQSFKVLSYIQLAKGATKYDCVTKILGREGTKRELRGYYSDAFADWTANNILTLNRKTHKYHLTAKGLRRLTAAASR